MACRFPRLGERSRYPKTTTASGSEARQAVEVSNRGREGVSSKNGASDKIPSQLQSQKHREAYAKRPLSAWLDRRDRQEGQEVERALLRLHSDGRRKGETQTLLCNLGLKSELRKWEAERELGKIIEKETQGNGPARPDDTVTFQWFWENRYLPLRESSWRRSTKEAVHCVFKIHVLPRFGESRLRDLTRFDLQTLINALAKEYSRSVAREGPDMGQSMLGRSCRTGFFGEESSQKA